MIKIVEDAIVQRIANVMTLPGQQHPKIEVRSWPSKPREYKMTHPYGCALVIYQGSKYSDDKATGGQYIEYDDLYEIGLISRTLREPNVPDITNAGRGIYELLESCRDALMGWQPDQARTVVRIKSIIFDDYAEGTWSYSLKVAVPMMTVTPRACPSEMFDSTFQKVDFVVP